MTNADALLTIDAKGNLVKTPTQVIGISGSEGHEAKVNAGGELLVRTTLIAGEITIGNVKIEGSGGHVAEVNAEGELQTNTKNIVVEHVINKVENVNFAVPNGYEQVTVWLLGVFTGATVKTVSLRGSLKINLPLVNNNSEGAGEAKATLLTGSATPSGFSGNVPSGVEQIIVQVEGLATGEITVVCVFGNEPWLPPSLGIVATQGRTSVGSEPATAPVLVSGVDNETKIRRLLTDGEGVQAVYPFETSHPWSSGELTVNKEAPEKKEETVPGIAGFRFVITNISVDADNTETLTEFGNVLVKIVEETSGRLLWRGNLKGSSLTKGSSQSINIAANPIAITTTTGKGIILKIEKAVKGAEGTVTCSGYMIKA